MLAWGGSCRAAQKLKDSDCLTCHGDSTLTTDENGKQVSLYVDKDKLKHSFHGRLFGCVDCHTDVKSLVHDAPPKKITCAGCHEAAQQAYARSMHAKPAKAGAALGATCVDCHGSAHEVLTPGNPASPVNHANIPATCGRCHGQKFITSSNGDSAQTFVSYQESVHGRAIENGSQKAAVCTDCHGAHEILAANEDHSPIYKFNVPATCGKCHADITQTFMASIHGQGIARGNGLAPVCTDCHGIHSIKKHRGSQLAGRRNRTCRRTPARAAMKACGFRRSSACPAIASPPTWTAITGWPRRAARLWPPTARAATESTTSCPRAIPARPSTMPISAPPAASATRA